MLKLLNGIGNIIMIENKLNENIVPNELIIGVNKSLCYITYNETKNGKSRLNSEYSWSNWRDTNIEPIVIQNKFAKGFRFSGVNGRYYNDANNQSNVLIEHPLFKYDFEIPLQRLYEITSICDMKNGIMDIELIVDKKRNLITKVEYADAIIKFDAEVKKKNEILQTNKNNKVKPKNQIKGVIYKNLKNDRYVMYLGKVKIANGIEKFCYYDHIYDKQIDPMYREYEWQNKPNSIELPFLLYTNRALIEMMPRNIKVIKNRLQLSKCDLTNETTIFDEFADNIIDLIKQTYQKDPRDMRNYCTYWHGETTQYCEIDWFE